MRRSYLRTVITKANGEYLSDFVGQGVVVQRAYQTHTAAMKIPEKHPAVAALVTTPEPRGEVWMITEDLDAGTATRERVTSGRVISAEGSGPYGSATVNIADDKSLLDTVLGWPKPTAGLTGQNVEYAVYTGATETVVKAAIAANATRLGLPWDIVPTRGVGPSTTRLELRMHDLTRKVMPLLEAARLILTVERQSNGRWMVDVVAGDTYTGALTPESGVLASWEWTIQYRTATRGVGGGRGDGVDRQFKQYVDTAAETAVGYPLEVFLDARQTEDGVDFTPEIVDEVKSRRPVAGFTPEIQEAGWFRFPDAYRIGTRVPVKAGAFEVNDVITQIEIAHDDKGFRVTPTIGLATSDPQQQLLKLVRQLAAQVRGLERR